MFDLLFGEIKIEHAKPHYLVIAYNILLIALGVMITMNLKNQCCPLKKLIIFLLAGPYIVTSGRQMPMHGAGAYQIQHSQMYHTGHPTSDFSGERYRP